MSHRFLLTGIGGVWNYGCEAIVRSTTDMLVDAFPGCEVMLVSPFPAADSPALSDAPIRIVPMRPPYSPYRAVRKVLRTLRLPSEHILEISPSFMRRATCVLSIGGDIYTPHACGFQWSTLRGEQAMMRSGCPLVLWGATVGPFDPTTPEGRVLRDYLRQLLLITARESISVDYLKSVGVEDRVVPVADPAFVLRPEPFDLHPLLPERKHQFLLGINLSPLLGHYLGAGGSVERVVALGAECVQAALDALPVSVVLIPHVIGMGEENDDASLLNRIAQRLGDAGGRLSVLPSGLGACRTKYAAGRCDAVVAARMHCAIGALSSGTPTLCISYSLKSLGVLGDLFSDDRWILPLSELSPSRLVQRLEELLASRADIKRHLESGVPVFQERARAGARALRERLAESAGHGRKAVKGAFS